MPFPSVTYNFSNGSTADADAVDQNFTDIINGISDGTKDISVSAGTFAGNVSISGNTTLGNASSDTITFTGSMASTLPVGTTNSYDIGSSTLGLRAIYFGANSQTVNIKGSASMSATWTFTFPVSAGTSTYVLQTDGAGVTSWVSKTVLSTVSKTTTYTATSSDDVILCSTSGGAWTLTLPAAASNTGKRYFIKKTTSDVNALTIDGNASETIDGATTVPLVLQYEAIEIECDGSNWHVINKKLTTKWTSWTPTGSWTANVTYTGYYRRVGQELQCRIKVICSGAPTSAALTITLPNSWTADTAVLPDGSSRTHLGFGSAHDEGTEDYSNVWVKYVSTTTVGIMWSTAGLSRQITQAVPFTFGNTDYVEASWSIPISGWDG